MCHAPATQAPPSLLARKEASISAVLSGRTMVMFATNISHVQRRMCSLPSFALSIFVDIRRTMAHDPRNILLSRLPESMPIIAAAATRPFGCIWHCVRR